MRIESSVTAISWIPSEMVSGLAELPFSFGAAHYDEPPPDRLDAASIPDALDRLRLADRFRVAHHLGAWVEVGDGAITDFGQVGGGVLGRTTLRLGRSWAVAATAYDDLRAVPEVGDGWVRFRQSAGGRTGVPAPRHVNRPPWVQLSAPTAWTTLELTIHVDGRSELGLVGASPFPRHWIYDHSGALVKKSGLVDFTRWYRHAFGSHSPWGDQDSKVLVAEVESELERRLGATVMRGGARPAIRTVRAGEVLAEQGEPGAEVWLVLDGILVAVVDGRQLAELGPGAVVGERAHLETGCRTATLVAVTDCKVAAVEAEQLDRDALGELSRLHRHEDRCGPVA